MHGRIIGLPLCQLGSAARRTAVLSIDKRRGPQSIDVDRGPLKTFLSIALKRYVNLEMIIQRTCVAAAAARISVEEVIESSAGADPA